MDVDFRGKFCFGETELGGVLGEERLEGGGVGTVVCCDEGALFEEGFGRFEADAAVSAGNECDAVCEGEVVGVDGRCVGDIYKKVRR